MNIHFTISYSYDQHFNFQPENIMMELIYAPHRVTIKLFLTADRYMRVKNTNIVRYGLIQLSAGTISCVIHICTHVMVVVV